MNAIIIFHFLNIDFLKEFFKEFDKRSLNNLVFIKNYSNNEAYSTKYNCDFLHDNAFLEKQKNGEILCSQESYFINGLLGLNLCAIKNHLKQKKIVLLHASIRSALLLKKKIKNINFISVLIETENHNYKNQFMDLKKKFLIIEKIKTITNMIFL